MENNQNSFLIQNTKEKPFLNRKPNFKKSFELIVSKLGIIILRKIFEVIIKYENVVGIYTKIGSSSEMSRYITI